MTKKLLAPSAFVLILFLGVYGCNSPESDIPTTTPIPAADVQDDHDHMGDDHADHDHVDHGEAAQKTDMEKMTENLASFSSEDRASAIKQHFCPVSDEMLGSMGAPKKIDVDGQAVWICCDGCKDKLLAEPEKYLAKLPE
jgi:Cu(I)/Ag(I) efflux system membrane fusion protein